MNSFKRTPLKETFFAFGNLSKKESATDESQEASVS